MQITRMEDVNGIREVFFSSTAFDAYPTYDTWVRAPQQGVLYQHGIQNFGTTGDFSAPLAVYPMLAGSYIKLFVFRANTYVDPAPPNTVTILPCSMEVRYINSQTGVYIGTDGEVDLSPVAIHFFVKSNAAVNRLLGMPNADTQMGKSSIESVMFHDDTTVYSLVATHGVSKTFEVVTWADQTVGTGYAPTAAADSGVTFELAYFGSGKYLAVCRPVSGIRKTLSVSLGSPFTGWTDIAPDYMTPAGGGTAEYLHVEPVWHDPATGGLYMEGVLKIGTDHRFAVFRRRATETAYWRLLGRVQNMPSTGNAAFGMTSYGRQAFGLKKRRTPASRSTYFPTSNDTTFTAIGARATGPLSYEAFAI